MSTNFTENIKVLQRSQLKRCWRFTHKRAECDMEPKPIY